MRIKITLSYDGTDFEGFQVQAHTSNTIAGALYVAFQNLHIDSKIIASGRTDKAVHATGQVIHIDLPAFWTDLVKLKEELTRKLPLSIVIQKVVRVDDNFHARYHAKKRRYRYLLSTQKISPFNSRYITSTSTLDLKRLQQAIKCFEGTHDFIYFHKQGSEPKSTIRSVFKAYAYKHKNIIVLRFDANSFLRSQIRFMVGALIEVSKGTLSVQALEEQLRVKKQHVQKLAQPNGLYLSHIFY